MDMLKHGHTSSCAVLRNITASISRCALHATIAICFALPNEGIASCQVGERWLAAGTLDRPNSSQTDEQELEHVVRGLVTVSEVSCWQVLCHRFGGLSCSRRFAPGRNRRQK